MSRGILILIFIVTFISCTSNNPTLPPVGLKLEDLKDGGEKNSFNTYTTFFSARKVSLKPHEKAKQNLLVEAFNNFSRGIGENNVAIWVGENYKKFDTSISKDLCDMYSVSYTGGPYILFSKNNPTLGVHSKDKDILLDFTHVNPDRIIFVLDDLEQKIRQRNYIGINKNETYKQIVFSKYENYEDFIKEVVKSIL